MKQLSKFIITRWNEAVLTMVQSEGETVQLNLEPEAESSILGNIYIGKVKNIVKNIGAAFVEIGDGSMGYLNLSENCIHYASETVPERPLRAGDEIVVQVERDAVKTKAPVLTGNLNFTGRFLVLTAGKRQLGFSAKLTDTEWKKEIKPILEAEKEDDFGIIVRTNAPEASADEILDELKRLKARYRRVMADAGHRTCYSLLYRTPPTYLSDIRDSFHGSLEAIITDERDILESVRSYLEEFQPEDLPKLTLYDDALLPLSKLYKVEKSIEEALGKRVWLKSGGYLVIEPTEALCVIDVNTGKYSGKKNLHDTIMKINKEAAVEIARQLRLRNLSGIIIIDFIDMETEADQKELLTVLSRAVSRDPVKTSVVEITKLNLVEVTRKKIRRPFYEQAAQIKGKAKT